MLTDKVLNALNQQLNGEANAAYSYLAMAAYFEAETRPGMAHWMKIQAQEEREHMMKLYGYIHERGGRVTLQAIQKPSGSWASPLAAFEDALAHEQRVTRSIEALIELAIQEKDYATQAFLQWFVTEQVEEESTARDLITSLKRIGDDNRGLFLLDRELATRQA